MSDDRCFVDSNVFMYAIGKEHPLKDRCVRIVNDLELGRTKAAVNTEVLQELLYRYSRIGENAKAVELCRQIMILPIEVWPVGSEDIGTALNLFERFEPRGLEPRAAVHAAPMQRHGVRSLLSADRVCDLLEDIRRIDPSEYQRPLKCP